MAKDQQETKTPEEKPIDLKVPLGPDVPPKENSGLPNDYQAELIALKLENLALKQKSEPIAKAEPTIVEKSYFTPKGGDIQMCVPVQKDGKTVSEFFKFQNGKFVTKNPVYQAFLDNIMVLDADKPLKLRRVIDEDTFDEAKTPDNTMVSINGSMMNIKEVREGIDFAISKGWKPQYKEYMVMPQKVQVNKGGITAGNMSRK